MVVDPSLKEEAARAGLLTVVMNSHKEVCAVQKADGIGLSVAQARAPTFWGFSVLQILIDYVLGFRFHSTVDQLPRPPLAPATA